MSGVVVLIPERSGRDNLGVAGDHDLAVTSIAVHVTTASLASSDGWKELPKRKRRLPCTRGAMRSKPGRMQTSMSTRTPPICTKVSSR